MTAAITEIPSRLRNVSSNDPFVAGADDIDFNKPATSEESPFNGMGRVKLLKHLVEVEEDNVTVTKNLLYQDDFYKDGPNNTRVPNTNTVFEVPYEFELAEDITVPANCVLEFDGGSISASGSNDTITGNNTGIVGNYRFSDIEFSGTFVIDEIKIGDSYVTSSANDIVDIINSIINNTNIPKVVFMQSYPNLSKAIRIERDGVSLEGWDYRGINDSIVLRNISSTVETFYFEDNASLSCVATIVIGKANTRMRNVNVSNLYIQTINDNLTTQYGMIASGTHFTIKDCTVQGNSGGLKTYGAFLFTIKKVVARSDNGIAFDFSEHPSKVNTTTALIEDCFATSSRIGYLFFDWVYSTLESLACDVITEVSYQFNRCAVKAVSIGAENFSGSFIKLNNSKVTVSNPNCVNYLGCTNTEAFIVMTHLDSVSGTHSLLNIEGLAINASGMADSSYAKEIGKINVGTPSEKYRDFRNFLIGERCILELKNCNTYRPESFASSVAGVISNDVAIIGDCDNFYGVDGSTLSQRSDFHLNVVGGGAVLFSKDVKNVEIDNINNGSITVRSTDGNPVLQSCENLTIKNTYFLLSNTKMFADNSVQKNVVFESCMINVSSAAFNTIKDSNIVFKNCNFVFDQQYGTPYISASNSDFEFINCTYKIPGGFAYTGKVVDGTNKESGSTRPRNPIAGDTFFDESLSPKKMILYNGTAWVNLDGSSL